MKTKIEHYKNLDLIQVKPSINYPELSVIKYKREVFFDNLWDDFLLECRGLVVDSDYNVIIHPLTKMFNYGENGWFPKCSKSDKIKATLKYNGFMVAVTLHEKYGVIVSTTGSLDSEYVELAKSEYQRFVKDIPAPEMGCTQIFECCTHKDPHIIQEAEGFYYLGQRDTKGNWIPNPDTLFETTLDELFKNSDDIEGFVCYNGDEIFKIKTPRYLKKKFFARSKNIENALNKATSHLSEYHSNFDEDFYGIVDFVRENLKTMADMTEYERVKFLDENYFGVNNV